MKVQTFNLKELFDQYHSSQKQTFNLKELLFIKITAALLEILLDVRVEKITYIFQGILRYQKIRTISSVKKHLERLTTNTRPPLVTYGRN